LPQVRQDLRQEAGEPAERPRVGPALAPRTRRSGVSALFRRHLPDHSAVPVSRFLPLPALLLAAAVLSAGCGGGADEVSTTGPRRTATASETPAPKPRPTVPDRSEGIDPLSGSGTDPVTVRAANSQTALLTDVRVARHEGYDRVVFEFGNTLPGYDVRYVRRPVRQDGSGQAVDVSGSFIARIRMENALDADLSKPSAPRTYAGPTRLLPDTPQVVELVRVGGFEAVLTWVAGLRDRVDYRVTTLPGPPRLVVDFRNH
jgi:hypothetical protein